MFDRRMRAFVIAAIATAAMTTAAWAQITTGSVAGSVKDQQGGVIPGATVILVDEARGTRSTPVVTNATGDFVFVNVAAGTYTVEVTMPSFKMLKRSGLSVNPGTRTAVGELTIEVGGASETVNVKGEAPLIQATSGERSFTIATDSVDNLPLANRSFTQLATLAPGVTVDGNNTPTREGGGGSTNIMMDGVSTLDTGSNRPLLQMNVAAIAEVKVLTSNYQAEFGRASGVQVTAVTKSGTNRFRGSAYGVVRNSDWNSNTKVNKLNGDPKTTAKEKDLGYTIGGPVGKPGKANKLFFFYSHEFAPRTGGNNVVRFRMPTALERAGDFSQTTDNNGNGYTAIRDPRLTGTCSNSVRDACFADSGIPGKIPANMLYQPGLNILNMWPLPNCPGPTCSGWTPQNNYNFQLTRPDESILAWQPSVRLDYSPTQRLRATFKYSGWRQRSDKFNGSLPGFNDTKMQNPIVTSTAVSVNFNLNQSTFLEGTFGHSQNELAGCALAQSGTGPSFCTSAIPMNPISNLNNAGLGALPQLYPDANLINPEYYAVEALNKISPTPPFWVNGRVLRPPSFSWGGRISNTPPNIGFPGYFNINATDDFAVSLTKVKGPHTLKTGFYNTHSWKAENIGTNFSGSLNFQQDTVGTNPCDTSFGYANAATGCFSQYQQSQKYVETNAIYNNTEWYVQDNWKASRRLTLDYGVRFVHQQPQIDSLDQASNFLPDKWTIGQAPRLYLAGCANLVYPCSGTNRQAMNPLTNLFMGPNSNVLIGTVVPGSGNLLNGLFLPGQNGIPKATFTAPWLVIAPRFGMAYDISGKQRLVVRGGGGLFYDRPSSTTFSGGVGNPPTAGSTTIRFSTLQTLGSGGLTIVGVPSLNAFQYNGEVPSSVQWNGGMQMTLPWAISLDVSYVGQHSYNTYSGTNINAVDFGATFLPANLDTTLTPTTVGATAITTDQLRAIRGFGSISQQLNRGWRTYHSVQIAFNRRFQHGWSFGFNDVIGISDQQQSGARLQHGADGSYSFRPDQAKADELLGNNAPRLHSMKANFIWDLPDLRLHHPVFKVAGLIVNDWQLSGIWSGQTGSAYTVAFSYQSGGSSVNLTGSPDYGARVRIIGDPGSGCSSDPYRQFNALAFQGPLTNSDGLESGTGYLRNCFRSILDLAIARNIRLPHGRNIQLRADMFNAPNAVAITGRNATISLNDASDQATQRNLPFDLTTGALIDSRLKPRGAGTGVANSFQEPRTVQAQIRFTF